MLDVEDDGHSQQRMQFWQVHQQWDLVLLVRIRGIRESSYSPGFPYLNTALSTCVRASWDTVTWPVRLSTSIIGVGALTTGVTGLLADGGRTWAIVDWAGGGGGITLRLLVTVAATPPPTSAPTAKHAAWTMVELGMMSPCWFTLIWKFESSMIIQGV